jgi:hypothetical protein
MDTVSYEGNTADPYTEGSGLGLGDEGKEPDVGLSRSPDGDDSDVNRNDFAPRCLTPGQTNSEDTCLPPPQIASSLYMAAFFNLFINGEPNDACEEAIPININRRYEYLADDMNDWYEFDLTSSAQLRVVLSGFTPAGQVVLWKGQCGALNFLANNGDSQTTKILDVGVQTSGHYYVWVINDDAPTNVLYHLRVQTEAPPLAAKYRTSP